MKFARTYFLVVWLLLLLQPPPPPPLLLLLLLLYGLHSLVLQGKSEFCLDKKQGKTTVGILRPSNDVYLRVEETQKIKTHKILESRQPVRRPRFCTNSPSYKNQGVQITSVKILHCLFRA